MNWPTHTAQTKSFPGANLCSVSCMREMARGDTEFVTFSIEPSTRDGGPNLVATVVMEFPGLGTKCIKQTVA